MKRIIILILPLLLFYSLSADDSQDKIKSSTTAIKLNNVNLSGIGLLSVGVTASTAGIALFILDSVKNVSIRGKDTYYDYEYYMNRFENSNYILFASSLALIFSGAILATVSIPLLLYKEKNISLNLNAGGRLSIAVCCKF
jgi:hypothetical protein